MNEEALKDSYELFKKAGYTKSIDEYSELLRNNEDALNDSYSLFTKAGYTKSIEDFSVLVGVTQPQQEELTPKMVETGQRDAAPAYAMTEEKYAAEKKSPTESPLQDGVSADVVEEPVVEEDIEQPSEKYLIDGSAVSKGEIYRKLNNQNFLKSLETGDASIEVKDDPEMQKYLADRTKGLQKGFVEEGDEIITPDLMSKEEEDVVPYLNYQFGDQGFVFEESGAGDNVVAKALDSDGNVIAEEEFALDLSSRKAGSTIGAIFKEAFLTDADEEANRLKTWLDKNQDPVRKVEAQKQEQLLKFKDKSQIEKSFKDLASVEDGINESMNGFISKRTEFETELERFESERSRLERRIQTGTATQEELDAFNEKAKQLDAQQKELSTVQEEIKSSVESAGKRRSLLKKSVGRFSEYQKVLEEQGNIFGAIQTKLATGAGKIGGANISGWIDVLVEALPESAVRGVGDEKSLDEAQDELKKQLKAEIVPAVVEGAVDYFGGDVSPEYMEKIERLSAERDPLYFVYSAFLGAIESIPAMIGPSPSGKAKAVKGLGKKILSYLFDAGNMVRATSMAAQVSYGIEEEMSKNPAFNDISENEKRLISAPIAIVGGVLENVGFRNIVNKSGVLQDITMAVLRKSGKKVTAETFEDLVQKEVKSRIARGSLVLASGALAEAETGMFQEIGEDGLKRVYNAIKEKEMFDTEEAFSEAYFNQVMTATLQEAIGGMALGSVGALSSAMNNDYYFDSVSDIDFDLFTKMSENPEFKTSIVTDIKNKINSGEMTAEQGRAELENIEKIQAALNKIPSDYSAANKKKALSLIMRQDAIKRDVAGKDENLTKRQRAEIEKINQMLEDTDQQAFLEKERQDAIQKQSPEGVDVQEPAADSEAVGEGDVRETTTEGKPKITVKEETQEVTDETLKDLENVPEPVIRGLAVKSLNGETLTDQEQQVFDANQEAVEQMASDIEQMSQAEAAETERKLRGETSAEDRTIIARQVNRAKRAISKILPDVEIVMHDTEDSYNGVITDPDGKGSAGTYNPNTNKIHINMSKANPRTVSHEVFHAVVRRAFGGGKLSDPALSAATVKMLDAVKRGASKRMLSAKSSITGETVENYIKRFSEGYEKGQQSEEQLSELAGILAENFMELDVNAKTTIKAWIGRMAEKLGINKALGTKIYSREMTDKDAIDLLNTIAGKTAKGEIIKEAKTLEEMFGDEEIAESDKAMDARFQKEELVKFAETEISKKALNSIRTSVRNKSKAKDVNFAIDILDSVAKGEELPFEYDFLLDYITYGDVASLMVEDELFETKRQALRYLYSLGEGFIMKDFAETGVSSTVDISGRSDISPRAQRVWDGMTRFELETHPNSKLTKGYDVNKLNGKTAFTSISDRMASGRFEVDGESFSLLGGVDFANVTGDFWAVDSDGAATHFINQAERDDDGYIYYAPHVLGDESHISNRDMTEQGLMAIKRSGVKRSDFASAIKKVSELTSMKKSGLGKILLDSMRGKKSLKESVDAVMDIMLGDKITFPQRKAFNKTLLGSKGGAKFKDVGGYDKLTSVFMEGMTRNARAGDVVVVYRTKGDLYKGKKTKKGDPFHHNSYDIPIKSTAPIEVLVLSEPIHVANMFSKAGELLTADVQQYLNERATTGISEEALRSTTARTMNMAQFSSKIDVEDRIAKAIENAKKKEVSEDDHSPKFQSPTATAFTIYDAINELRGKGYTDSAIELFISRQINPDTQKKFTKAEIAKAMAVPIDIENTLPSAFGDVEGGIAQGQKMFTEVMEKVRRSAARMRPANPAKIRAKAHQILMAHPDFDKQSATMKNRLILGLDSALGTTANKAIQAEISSIKKMIKGGKMSLRELKAAQVRLRAMIRKELPNDKQYSKTVVNNLIKMVTDATPETMDQVVNDVTSAINEQRSERFISEIENIINQSFTTTQAGRKKGAKVTATFADAIAFAKERLAEMRKVADNEEDFQKLMEKTREERESLFSQIDTMTEEDISKILAYDLILEYGKTFVEENTEQSTVEALELSLDMAKDLVNTGRAFMKEQLRLAHEAYKEQFNTAFEDITGIDVRDMDEAQRKDVSGSLRIGAEQRNKNLSRVAKVMAKVFDRANTYFARNEDLSGFMDILSKGAGEMFGGKLQEIVKQRVDDSSNVYKKGMMDIREMTESKARDIFGKRWKKVISVGNRIPIETGLKAFGKDLIYSQNEMYYLYNMAKDPANHPSFEEKFGKDWRNIMDGIEKLMTPEVKEWADWQVNEFYPMMYERYNPVYRRIYRTNLGWNKFYAGKIYRQSVDGNEDINLLEQKMGPAMTVAGGSTKHRVKNNVPIAAVDGNLAMGRYIEEMEKFRAYQETVRDVNKIFNNEDIKNAIKEQYGESFHNLLSTMLERYLTGKTEKGNLGSIVGTGNRVFLFAKLGYNLSLVWKQLTSIPTYANDIGYANWALYSAKIWASPISTAKEIYENSTYIKDRYAGDFLAVVDVFSKNKENTISMGEGADFYINKTTDAITRYGMVYTKGGDAMAIFLGGAPNYLYYKNEFKKRNPSATEQQAIDYAIKKFEKDTRGTQQSSDIQDRDFYQTGNQFMRSMMLFTTSPRQYWRKSMSGYRQLYRKMKGVPSKGTVLENLRTILTYRIMMPMLYTWATMGFPPPWDLDDDEENELMWSALLGNISALFMIGHIAVAVKDFATDKPWAGRMPLPPIMQIAADMIEDMTSLSRTKDPIKREQKKEEVYMKMINNVLPQKNLDKSFGNWYRTSTGDQEFNLRKMAGYSDYVADKDARKMEEAMEALRKAQDKLNKGKPEDKRVKAGGKKAGRKAGGKKAGDR